MTEDWKDTQLQKSCFISTERHILEWVLQKNRSIWFRKTVCCGSSCCWCCSCCWWWRSAPRTSGTKTSPPDGSLISPETNKVGQRLILTTYRWELGALMGLLPAVLIKSTTRLCCLFQLHSKWQWLVQGIRFMDLNRPASFGYFQSDTVGQCLLSPLYLLSSSARVSKFCLHRSIGTSLLRMNAKLKTVPTGSTYSLQ